MKIISAFLSILFYTAAFPQAGYEIKANVAPFKQGYLYLGHHFGAKQFIIDSAKIVDGEAVFRGDKPLAGGVYMLIYPQKNGWFELILDGQQKFAVSSDTANLLQKTVFTNSSDNDLFHDYQKQAQEKGASIQQKQKSLPQLSGVEAEKTKQDIQALHNALQHYREQFLRTHPKHLLSAIFNILKEPQVPGAAQHPNGVYDSVFAYQYYKQHYWDGVTLTDNRLMRTPVFEAKLHRYFDQVLTQETDTVSKAALQLLEAAKADKEMFKYLLSTLTEKYIQPKYMGQDAVFLKLFEQYYAKGFADEWMSEQYRKTVFDRAYSIMGNQLGELAADMQMVDTTGKRNDLHTINARYTVVCFWDPTCGHCQTEVPLLDSLYKNSWKDKGVVVYGVMTDGGKDAWLNFIRKNNLTSWIHVHQPEEIRKQIYDSGTPGYKQLYDVYQTPVLFLLDKDKRIVAKKITPEQIGDFLQRLGQ